MWNKFVGILWWLFLKTRIYFLWSKIYRFLFHSRYSSTRLFWNLKLEQADRYLKTLTWTPDGGKELGDAIGSPQFVQFCINQRELGRMQPDGALDCDDFSIWATNVLDPSYRPMMFSVIWASREKPVGFWKKLTNPFTRFSGHAMCLTYDEKTGLYTHISNWGISKSYFTIIQHVEDILKMKNADLIGWMMFDKDLKLKKMWMRLK